MNERTLSQAFGFDCIDVHTAMQTVKWPLTIDLGRDAAARRSQKRRGGVRIRQEAESGQGWNVERAWANIQAFERLVTVAERLAVRLDDLRHTQAMAVMKVVEVVSESLSRKRLALTRKQYPHWAAAIQGDGGRPVAAIASPDMVITISCHTHELPSVETSAREEDGTR